MVAENPFQELSTSQRVRQQTMVSYDGMVRGLLQQLVDAAFPNMHVTSYKDLLTWHIQTNVRGHVYITVGLKFDARDQPTGFLVRVLRYTEYQTRGLSKEELTRVLVEAAKRIRE